MYKRFKYLCVEAGGFLGAGLLYAFICRMAGHPIIPCVFHMATGLCCPGCGVSRMCLALLRLDFRAAFRANAAIMLLLPFGIIIAVRTAVRYIKYGTFSPTQMENRILCIMTGILILFGIVRNFPGLRGVLCP